MAAFQGYLLLEGKMKRRAFEEISIGLRRKLMGSYDRASSDKSSGAQACPRMTVAAKEGRAIEEGCVLEIEADLLREQVKKLRFALEAIYDECDGQDVEDCRDGSGVRPNSWMRISTTARDALEDPE